MIEITCNDRLGKKIRVKCNPTDTIGDLKKLIAAQTGTRHDKIVLKKWFVLIQLSETYFDHFICTFAGTSSTRTRSPWTTTKSRTA